jgi:hypothetical protein
MMNDERLFPAAGKPGRQLLKLTALAPSVPSSSKGINDIQEFQMTDYEPFSLRKKLLAESAQPLPLEYDDLPQVFRGQVFLILRDIIGEPPKLEHWQRPETGPASPVDIVWDEVHDLIAREHGVIALSPLVTLYGGGVPKNEHLQHYLALNENVSTDDLIDAIEISFRCLLENAEAVAKYRDPLTSRLTIDEGIAELNRRFRQHGLGYRFDVDHRLIVRIDSEGIYEDIIKPALLLVRRVGFSGVEEEFRRAQEHLRHGRNEESMAEALKAFESTMKYICDQRGWTYRRDHDTASRLIEILLREGLIPEWAQNEFSSLRSILQSGVPTARNRNAGHGRGPAPRQIPDYLAAFALNMTASNIVFLVEAFSALPPRATP